MSINRLPDSLRDTVTFDLHKIILIMYEDRSLLEAGDRLQMS